MRTKAFIDCKIINKPSQKFLLLGSLCLSVLMAVSPLQAQSKPSIKTAPISMVRLKQEKGSTSYNFEIVGIPAIAKDGKSIVVADIDPDGGRGWPNLLVRILSSQNGKLKKEYNILDASQLEKTSGEIQGSIKIQVEKKIMELNQMLMKGEFTVLKKIAIPPKFNPEIDDRETLPLIGGGYVMSKKGSNLQIKKGGIVIAQKALPTLHVPKDCKRANLAVLEGAYIQDSFALVQIYYTGNDDCWEPAGDWILIPLPAK